MTEADKTYRLRLPEPSPRPQVPTPCAVPCSLRALQVALGAPEPFCPASVEVFDCRQNTVPCKWEEELLTFWYAPQLAPYTLRLACTPPETPPKRPAFIGAGDAIALAFPAHGAELGTTLHPAPMLVDWRGKGVLDLVTCTHPSMHKAGCYVHLRAPGKGNRTFWPAQRIEGLQGHITLVEQAPEGEIWCASHFAGGVLFKGKRRSGWCEFEPPEALLTTEGKPVCEGIRDARLWACDWDGDGTWDLLIGSNDWHEYWPEETLEYQGRRYHKVGPEWSYDEEGNWRGGPLHGLVYFARNVGSAAEPVFAPPAPLQVGGAILDVYGYASPCVAEWTPGERVLFVADFLGHIHCFKPVEGSPLQVKALGKLAGEFSGYPMPQWMPTLCAGDWTGEGRVDLLAAVEGGNVMVLENAGGSAEGLPRVRRPYYLEEAPALLNVHCKASVTVADLDGDGDLDLLLGNAEGDLLWCEDKGKPGEPSYAAPQPLLAGGKPFHTEAGRTGSLQGPSEVRWGYLNVCCADWDEDGLLEIFTCDVKGEHLYFDNLGTQQECVLAAPRQVTFQGKPLRTVWRVRPQVVKRTPESAPEYLTLDAEGLFCLYKRNPECLYDFLDREVLRYEDGSVIKLDEPGQRSGRIKLCAVDWTGTGTWDLLFGMLRDQLVAQPFNRSTVMLLENVGTSVEPRFAKPRQVLCGGKPLDFGVHSCTPQAVDLDGDGKPDLLVGSENGKVYTYLRRFLELGCTIELDLPSSG